MSTPIDPNSPLGIVTYYANLLIYQYLGKPKAYATIASSCAPVIMPQVSVQTIAFSDVPASGSFILTYNSDSTSAIQWDASSATIQSDLQTLSGLSSVTVSGSIASQLLTITFTGVVPPANLLSVSSNSLENSDSLGISLTITEIDQTLPLAVLNGFNLMGNLAVGAQLDVIGKYAGVSRSGNGPYGPITLDDADFLTLIKFAIIQNNSGSSLADIESNMNVFFPGDYTIIDTGEMTLQYFLSSSLGSSNLFLLLSAEKLIPAPMGVGITVILPPSVDIFGFRTYDGPNNSAFPFNTYDDYNTDWYWLSYSNSL